MPLSILLVFDSPLLHALDEAVATRDAGPLFLWRWCLGCATMACGACEVCLPPGFLLAFQISFGSGRI